MYSGNSFLQCPECIQHVVVELIFQRGKKKQTSFSYADHESSTNQKRRQILPSKDQPNHGKTNAPFPHFLPFFSRNLRYTLTTPRGIELDHRELIGIEEGVKSVRSKNGHLAVFWLD